MDVVVAREPSELDKQRDVWPSILPDAGRGVVCATLPWVESWYEGFTSAGQAEVWLFSQDGELAGAAPLVRPPGSRRIESAANAHTVYWDLIARDPERVLATFSEQLARDPDWDVVQLARVPGDSVLVAAGPAAFARSGLAAEVTSAGQNAVLACDGSWQSWAAAHPSLSKDTRLKQRRLAKLGELGFTTHSGRVRLSEGLETFYEIEAAAWKGAEGSAIRCSDELVRFYTRLSERAADAGWLALRSLDVDGKVIASQLWLAARGTAYLIKLGYDPEYRRHSPGNVLLYDTLEGWFREPDVGTVDWGPIQPGSWKERWGGEPRAVFDVWVYGSSLRARLSRARASLERRLRASGAANVARALRDRRRR